MNVQHPVLFGLRSSGLTEHPVGGGSGGVDHVLRRTVPPAAPSLAVSGTPYPPCRPAWCACEALGVSSCDGTEPDDPLTAYLRSTLAGGGVPAACLVGFPSTAGQLPGVPGVVLRLRDRTYHGAVTGRSSEIPIATVTPIVYGDPWFHLRSWSGVSDCSVERPPAGPGVVPVFGYCRLMRIEKTPEGQREFDARTGGAHDHMPPIKRPVEQDPFMDDTPLACGIEDPDVCESCQ